MSYMPPTKSGHNMFDMASLLQKAVRRGEFERAGYAAYEMYGGYANALWNRLYTISAEDCWGILTKELVRLRGLDEELNIGKQGYNKNPWFVSRAVTLLCKAKKSRDACYFSCNFVTTPNVTEELGITQGDIQEALGADNIPDGIFSISSLTEPEMLGIHIDDFGNGEQISLIPHLTPEEDESSHICGLAGAVMETAVKRLDMENLGWALNALRERHRNFVWKSILRIAVSLNQGDGAHEIIGLKLADDAVNKRKAPDKRDEIYLSKAALILCYEVDKGFPNVLAYPAVNSKELINWKNYRIRSIAQCTLDGGVIPEYVYDVHTIKGKKAGHTDWEMNLVEQAALNPLQVSYFDEGSWEMRYDWKYERGMCSEKEYLASLEYRKTHVGNPLKNLK